MNVVTRLESLRRREHAATVDIIEALVECRRSKAYLALGYSTIWAFLVEHLKYSNAAASRRYKAMKCAERDPEVLSMLREHRTSLSALASIETTHARSEHPKSLLAEIDGKPARAVEQAVAKRNPVKPRRETVRRKFVKPAATPLLAERPATEERVHLSLSLSPEDFEKLEAARAILSRKLPAGLTLEKALVELVDFYLKKKCPQPKRPHAKPRGRHIPRALRDEVMVRDGERCTFESPDGHRCNSTHNLQIDHIQPFAAGGPTTYENLRILCANHNRHRSPDRVPTRKSGASVGGAP